MSDHACFTLKVSSFVVFYQLLVAAEDRIQGLEKALKRQIIKNKFPALLTQTERSRGRELMEGFRLALEETKQARDELWRHARFVPSKNAPIRHLP